MTAMTKNTLRSIMKMAWQFVKKNGYTMSEALKTAWLNIKLKARMRKGIVKFYFTKVDGSLREAFGTLASNLVPATSDGRKENPTLQVYYDTEKEAWRCFKIANLMRIA